MLATFFDIVMHLDQHLLAFFNDYGLWVYVLLAGIIFSETGLLVFAFLPGDSLLFAAGSLARNIDQGVDIHILFVVLCLASIFGNKINYFIGRYFGNKILSWKYFAHFNRKHIPQARLFYGKHGGKTIIFARFLPVIRTFVPFVAGMSGMNRIAFSFYNLTSALIWIGSLLGLGYWFGSLDIVKEHFSLIVYAIIAISLLPIGVTYLSKRSSASKL
jgi:membrane-associated protein